MNQAGRKTDGLLKCWTTIVRFMKIPHTSLSLAGMILCCEIASGQGFVNLGFENTTLTRVLVNEYSGYYSTNATIPGWDWSPHANAGYSDPNTTVAFNDLALAASAVTLEGTNGPYRAISGKYSILLQGGSSFVSSASYASIGQTGQIPSSALSLIYWGGALQASFNGQPLAFYAMSNDPNSRYGAQIFRLMLDKQGSYCLRLLGRPRHYSTIFSFHLHLFQSRVFLVYLFVELF